MKCRDAARFFGGAIAVHLVMSACSAVNAVPNAHAAGTPEESVESCDKIYSLDPTTHYKYAEHAYPGVSAAALASVVALVTMPAVTLGSGGSYNPAGFQKYSTTVWVRDGAVAAPCGVTNSPTTGTAITFVRRVD